MTGGGGTTGAGVESRKNQERTDLQNTANAIATPANAVAASQIQSNIAADDHRTDGNFRGSADKLQKTARTSDLIRRF
jgi:hypothetical protein